MRISDWSSDVCSSDLVAEEEAATTNCRRGVPAGGCGKQAMDGLRRRVRHGCLPSRGASSGRGAAVSEASATNCSYTFAFTHARSLSSLCQPTSTCHESVAPKCFLSGKSVSVLLFLVC